MASNYISLYLKTTTHLTDIESIFSSFYMDDNIGIQFYFIFIHFYQGRFNRTSTSKK